MEWVELFSAGEGGNLVGAGMKKEELCWSGDVVMVLPAVAASGLYEG